MSVWRRFALALALLAPPVAADDALWKRLDETAFTWTEAKTPLGRLLSAMAEWSPVPFEVDLDLDDIWTKPELEIDFPALDLPIPNALDLLGERFHFAAWIRDGRLRIALAEDERGCVRPRRFDVSGLWWRLNREPFVASRLVRETFLGLVGAPSGSTIEDGVLTIEGDVRASDSIDAGLDALRHGFARRARWEGCGEAIPAGLLWPLALPGGEWVRVRLDTEGYETEVVLPHGAWIVVAPGAALRFQIERTPVPERPGPVERALAAKAIAVAFEDEPLAGALRVLAEAAGVTILVDSDLARLVDESEDSVTVRMPETNALDALELICSIHRLTWEERHGAVLVSEQGCSGLYRLQAFDLRGLDGVPDLPEHFESIRERGGILLARVSKGWSAEEAERLLLARAAIPPTLSVDLGDGSFLAVLAGVPGRLGQVRLRADLESGERVRIEVDGATGTGRLGEAIPVGPRRVRVVRTGS